MDDMDTPFVAAVDRELTADDIGALDTLERSKAPTIKALRTRHHRLARMLAEGMSEKEAAIACDYDISRVSILKTDPAFSDLVLFYRQKVDAQYVDLHRRLADIAENAAGILNERLEDAPEEFSNGELMKLTAMGADRTGHGPSSTTTHELGSGFAARLEAARRRRQELNPLTVIEGEVLDD